MVVQKVYRDLELNKQEREREEKKLGIKKRIKLEFENTDPPKEKQMNGAVEGTYNEYFFYLYWVSSR